MQVAMKFSTQIVFLVTSVFWYNVTPDLTFGDLYSHFCVENLEFLFISPWAIIYNTTKTGFKWKVSL